MNDQTSISEHEAKRIAEQLRALPHVQPPAQVMQKLSTLAAHRSRSRFWSRTMALAASVGLATVLGDVLATRVDPPTRAETVLAAVSATEHDGELAALRAQSAYLESVLSTIPVQGRVQRVSTASTITALEDRVALIDAHLNRPEVQADQSGQAVLWRERIGLMSTLVTLRDSGDAPIWL